MQASSKFVPFAIASIFSVTEVVVRGGLIATSFAEKPFVAVRSTLCVDPSEKVSVAWVGTLPFPCEPSAHIPVQIDIALTVEDFSRVNVRLSPVPSPVLFPSHQNVSMIPSAA